MHAPGEYPLWHPGFHTISIGVQKKAGRIERLKAIGSGADWKTIQENLEFHTEHVKAWSEAHDIDDIVKWLSEVSRCAGAFGAACEGDTALLNEWKDVEGDRVKLSRLLDGGSQVGRIDLMHGDVPLAVLFGVLWSADGGEKTHVPSVSWVMARRFPEQED